MTYEPPPIEHHPCVDTRGGDVRLVHTWDQRGTGECVDCKDVCNHPRDVSDGDGHFTCPDCGSRGIYE